MHENTTRRAFVAGLAALTTGCVGGGTTVDNSAPVDERLRQRALQGIESASFGSDASVQLRDMSDGYGVTVRFRLAAGTGKIAAQDALYQIAKSVYDSTDDESAAYVEIEATKTLVNEYGESSVYVVARGRLERSDGTRMNWDSVNVYDVWRVAEQTTVREEVM